MAKEAKTMVSVKNVSKSFKLPHERVRSLKGIFVNIFQKKSFEKQEVLHDISLDIKDGEFFGIVGRNGSGKSTLLKLLAGIYVPDEGSVELYGKLTPFIELGVGFNPELTGRENVFLNGALIGFSRREMAEIYEEIVEFAELERFMDQKLKNYSSGMQVRLAFSVAIKARTSILLIDEVLAVGDANFQKKCIDVFEKFKKEGRTIVFVSHSMTSVKRFCDRAVLIEDGRIKLEGEPDIIATEYDIINNEEQKSVKGRLALRSQREAHIVDAVLDNFDQKDYLLEIGAADGRHVNILNSMKIKAVGVDMGAKSKSSPKRNVFNDLKEVKSTEDVSGLLILDNRKSINLKYLEHMFAELSEGKLKNVQKVYVHLPFHMYQDFLEQQKNVVKPSHLGDPLGMYKIIELLDKHQFIMLSSGLYNTDKELQYAEAVFERLDSVRKSKLWG